MTKATQAPTRFDPATKVLVVCRFGKITYFAERDEERADLKSTIDDLCAGQFRAPTRVYAFDPQEGHAADISEDVCLEMLRREQSGEVSFEDCPDIEAFLMLHVEQHVIEAQAA